MSETPISPFGCEYINDLSAIAEETDITDFLLHRVERGQLYTWVGPLLLAVNPERPILHDLFNDSKKSEYLQEIDQLPRNTSPHVYAVVTRARYRLIQSLGKTSQVIVISGESGTGKTFNSQKIINFLVEIDKNQINLKCPDGVNDIATEISQICPLIAAFSTAATECNPRSSRHGQLIQLQYSEGIIKGARVNSFLLERTRVTMKSKNFDIFYQLINGVSEETLSSLGLSPLARYAILGERSISQEDTYKSDFQETLRAMRTLGFTERCQEEIFQVLALLLLMGNIKFREKTSETFVLDTEDDESRIAVESTCKLSEVREHELNELLTSTLICPKSRRRRHTLYRRGLRTREACRHRLSSVIRWIYDKLFHWLVDRINEGLSKEEEKDCECLGILDIFGFESFVKNGIEQLCINYSTERLQLYFMENYLDNEQKELEYEGLSIIPPPPTLLIYRNRLFVIEQALFSTMNDAAQSPLSPDPSALSQQLYMRHSSTRNFLKPWSNGFILEHYSRPVEYDIHDIIEKNEDKVPVELSTAFYETENTLLKVVTNVPEDVVNDNGKIGVKKCTTLSKLKSSMDSLMQELNECDVHYVRCVRPRYSDGSWQKEEFREQLASSGILDALPLAKCKFPIRLTYEEFAKRYSHPPVIGDVKSQCRLAVEKMSGGEALATSIHLGHRRIFITEDLFFEFECLRKKIRSDSAGKIASFWLKKKLKKSSDIKKSLRVEKFQEIRLKPAIIVTRPSLPSIGEEDVFLDPEVMKTPLKPPADDQNNNTEGLKSIPVIALNDTIIYSWSPMRVIQSAESPKINEDDSSLQQRMIADSLKHQPIDANSNGGWRAKDFYVAEWLENISPPSGIVSDDIDVSSVSKDSGGTQQNKYNQSIPRKYGKFSKSIFNEVKPAFDDFKEIKWNSDGESCVIHINQCEKLFYRSRMLSKRRISESPVRFHTKKTCLKNSHCLPQSELPRGLPDCL